MSATIAEANSAPAPDKCRTALQRAQAALYVGIAAALGLAAISAFVITSSDDGKFHHIGDYFLTADGIP